MKILITDDDIATREMLKKYFEKLGYTIYTATNGKEALEIIKTQQIGIAIIDLIMPEMNGIETCQKLRELDIPNYVYVILLTVKENSEDLLSGFSAGIDEYLFKPIRLKELHARIKVGMRIVDLEQSLRTKQERLLNLVNVRNRLLGIAAHDLRNPATTIRGFSELLLKGNDPLTSTQREFISIVHSTSNSMLDLLNDLLDLSQIESGKLHLKKKEASIKALVEERMRLYKLHADSKRIAIHSNLDDIPVFNFDYSRIGQALDNLISNALKFSPQGTNVFITLAEKDDMAVFSIQDEGPGIPTEEQDLLFNEFQRLSVRPTGSESSTGLGLAITKRIIEAHAGDVYFESHVGIGSIFRFKLPTNRKNPVIKDTPRLVRQTQ
jgi:two-component system, sensor histidine kinase and response regulator